LFDDADHIGAGHVYNLAQPETNWINISERALELAGRPELEFRGTPISGFPSYQSWAGLEHDPWPADLEDTFPPRALVGEYLHARARSLIQPLVESNAATLVEHRVQRLTRVGDRWRVEDARGQSWVVDEILLTVGHQPTTTDDQIAGWRDEVAPHDKLLLRSSPYPISPVIDHLEAHGGNAAVAIRGYGLAMMDVVRQLAVSHGTFTSGDDQNGDISYRQHSGSQLSLVPFSLNGLPMSPKPLTPGLDALFAPTAEELERLEDSLRNQDAQDRAEGASLLIETIVPIAARVFLDLPQRHAAAPTACSDLESLISDWLRDDDTEHPSLDDPSANPEIALQRLVSMAIGESPIRVDYCVGQVWRHCHPTIYASLSYNQLDDNALAATIALDERIKRYSFGPPVESIRQLCALSAAGVLNLDFLDDPDIDFVAQGWTLSSDGAAVTASIMVDSVLDGPRIEAVVAPLITDLLDQTAIQPIHDEFGIATDEDATVLTGRPGPAAPLAVLGRLAKGTVIGVDAILECYGDRPHRWARGAVARLAERLDQ